jgi:cytochrome P450
MEPAIRKRADDLVDSFADAGGADLVARYTSPLPVGSAAELFGFAPADVATARSGSESLFRLGSADLTEQEEADAARAFVAFQHLLADHVRRRRATPTGDLISDVVTALAAGVGPLTFDQEAELVGTISSTFGASHITTTDTIGNALRMLLGHPEQWELLDLPQGADILLVFASTNRDEDRYPDADRFEATRTPTRHFGFGAGVHTCVGAAPARTQARIALRTLVERLPSLRLAPDRGIPIRRSINVRGPLALELHW